MTENTREFHTLDRPVVLIGLMGAGKTQIGRSLAQAMGVPFVDADAEVEAAAGATIADIFERLGEAAFREGEQRVMRRLLDGPPCVLAAGGGAYMDPTTRAVIQDRGLSVWLKADLDILVRRTAGKAHRPLLMKGDPRAILEALMEKRYPVYAGADITVETWDEPPQKTVDRVLDALDGLINTQMTD